ncbi:hypothetical protein ANRL1_01890 [Anaerolineae bacterium]|nr:hypothetical protein ANRL1_01890 [Anaerolineae bacterium]
MRVRQWDEASHYAVPFVPAYKNQANGVQGGSSVHAYRKIKRSRSE